MGETAEQRANTMCYIARETRPDRRVPVGTVVCVTVDDPKRFGEAAKDAAKWLRQGLIVERVPAWWVRKFFGTTEPMPAMAPIT